MTDKSSFYIYVDSEGKMPVLSHQKRDIHGRPNYTRYINGKPVAYHGPVEAVCGDTTRTMVWDYSKNEYVPIESLAAE